MRTDAQTREACAAVSVCVCVFGGLSVVFLIKFPDFITEHPNLSPQSAAAKRSLLRCTECEVHDGTGSVFEMFRSSHDSNDLLYLQHIYRKEMKLHPLKTKNKLLNLRLMCSYIYIINIVTIYI